MRDESIAYHPSTERDTYRMCWFIDTLIIIINNNRPQHSLSDYYSSVKSPIRHFSSTSFRICYCMLWICSIILMHSMSFCYVLRVPEVFHTTEQTRPTQWNWVFENRLPHNAHDTRHNGLPLANVCIFIQYKNILFIYIFNCTKCVRMCNKKINLTHSSVILPPSWCYSSRSIHVQLLRIYLMGRIRLHRQ